MSALARKWLAKMTQMAVLSKITKKLHKNAPKAWFSITSDFKKRQIHQSPGRQKNAWLPVGYEANKTGRGSVSLL